MSLQIQLNDSLQQEEVVALYRANDWSSADKPEQLLAALRNSHSLVTARLDAAWSGLAMPSPMVIWWSITRTCWYIRSFRGRVSAGR